MGQAVSRLILRFRDSLFTIPLAFLLICAGAAAGALFIDATFADTIESWPIILGTTVPGGRAIATTVAGATITVAAIVFSITALSTQMAASQYSPRVLGGFFEDPFQQSIIGLVMGTFTYSLLVLASLSNAIIDGGDPTPSLSVTLCIVLGVASVIGIVAYINHSLRRMQIDSVVQRIAAAATSAIEHHLSERKSAADVTDSPPPEGDPRVVLSQRGGWVVAIDPAAALEAIPAGSTARIDVRVGEAVSIGDRIVTIWPDPGKGWNRPGKLRRAVVTSSERSVERDPTFGIRQLVDIALRALSPGVNDPTTAVDVIHNLKTPIRSVLLADPPKRVFTGDEGRRLFLSQTPSRSDYVHAAFSEIRLAAGGQPYVLSALLEVLEDLLSDLGGADLEGRAGAVQEEIELTLDLARSSDFPDPDLARVLKRTSASPDG